MGKHCNCVHLQFAADESFTQYGTIIKQYQLPDLNWDLAEKGLAWDLQYIRERRKKQQRKQKFYRQSMIILEFFVFVWLCFLLLSLFSRHYR